jgi:hypothetical protein
VERRLAEVEAGFAKNLELVKRDVLNKDEFNKANVTRREERTRLMERQVELTVWVAEQHDRLEIVKRPTRACARSSRTLNRSTCVERRRCCRRSRLRRPSIATGQVGL